MGRRLLAIGLAFALQVGALTAPLVHAHVGHNEDGHVGATRIHSHAGGHAHQHEASSDAAVVHGDEDQDRVVNVPAFVAASAHAYLQPALPQAPFSIAEVGESLVRQQPDVVRSHGPPDSRPSAPRAPPVFPS